MYLTNRLAIKCGIQFSIALHNRYTISYQKEELDGGLSNLGLKLRDYDFSIPIGASYEYKNIVVDARYNISTNKMFVDSTSATRHSVFQLTVGYKFKHD